jgi:uncharacterized protein
MGENRWIEENSWPPQGTEFTDYYLHSGGSANSINGDGTLSLERVMDPRRGRRLPD